MTEHRTSGALCGCTIVEIGGFYRIDYCLRHAAADELYEALRGLCWESRNIDTPPRWFAVEAGMAALALADGEKDGG
jgi:hypothetical protein